jgi:predicted NBD/HSP70 family sugar kinase
VSGTVNGQPALLREINERTVYQTIRELHPVSRAEVARLTGLSKPTVSLALRTLEQSALVEPCGHDDGGPGRAALLYQPVPVAALGVGIALDVGRVHAVLVDLDGRQLAATEVSPTSERSDDLFGAVAAAVDELAPPGSPDRQRLVSAVVGTPGVIAPTDGRLTQAGILPHLDGTHPADELGRRLELPVTVLNDVDLAALAEQAVGQGRGVPHFAVIWVGSGLGAALVLNGELYAGARGGAGEIIDVPFRAVAAALGATLDDDSADAPTGELTDPSGGGFRAVVSRLVGTHPEAARELSDPFDPRLLLDAVANANPLALAAVEQLADRIAWYAASVSAVVDPQLLALAGSIGSHPALAEPVRRALANLLTTPPEVVSSDLGSTSVLTGAAALASRQAIEVAFARRDLVRSA